MSMKSLIVASNNYLATVNVNFDEILFAYAMFSNIAIRHVEYNRPTSESLKQYKFHSIFNSPNEVLAYLHTLKTSILKSEPSPTMVDGRAPVVVYLDMFFHQTNVVHFLYHCHRLLYDICIAGCRSDAERGYYTSSSMQPLLNVITLIETIIEAYHHE